jgi:hypothetical protein
MRPGRSRPGTKKIALAAFWKKKEDGPQIGISLFLGPGDNRMSAQTSQCRTLFDELKPGDRIEVEHMVTVGRRSWPSRTVGRVVRTERRGHGPHFSCDYNKVRASDSILLELSDGELTTIAVDGDTLLRRA